MALRVTVRVPDLDAFIQRYSRHVVGDRIFIFSKSQQPLGTMVRFHLQLPSGEALLSGKGVVKRVQAEGGDARHPPGMELQFEPLDERSKTLVDFMLATRAGMTADVVAADAPPIVRAMAAPKPAPPSKPLLPPRPAMAKSLPSIPILPVRPTQPPPSRVAPPPPAAMALAPPLIQPAPDARPAAPSLFQPAPDPSPQEIPTFVDAPPSDAPAGAEPVAVAAPGEATSKPIPVARPPSLSLEAVWKAEAGEVPANPFSEVSDNAIEYFVEWSFDQSIGPRTTPQAQFSDVPMAAPAKNAHPLFEPASRRLVVTVGGGLFAAGLLIGAVTVALWRRAPPAPSEAAAPPAAVAAAPTPAPVTTPPAPPPAAAAAHDAELLVQTRPPGATVTIDGEPAGRTPLSTKVTPGEHAVALTKERYATATSTVEAPSKLQLDLRRPPATLHVTSTPPAADVLIAGERRGRTPCDVRLPGFESYDVRVALAGTKPWRKMVYLGRASNRLDVALITPPKRR